MLPDLLENPVVMYVYVCVSTYVGVSVHVCVFLCWCVCTCVCVSMLVCMYMYVCVSTYVGVYVHVCVFLCWCVYTCVCVSKLMYIYLCLYTYVCVSMLVCIGYKASLPGYDLPPTYSTRDPAYLHDLQSVFLNPLGRPWTKRSCRRPRRTWHRGELGSIDVDCESTHSILRPPSFLRTQGAPGLTGVIGPTGPRV